jgi:nitrogen regulatory protein PII
MKILIIVARDSMLNDLEHVLHNNGVNAYTVLKDVIGKGVTGSVLGTFLHPEINTIIFSVLPPDLADRAVSALKRLPAERTKDSGDARTIPLKVFSFPCEEHV